MSKHDSFGVYVIKDNGAGDSSLPFLQWQRLLPFASSAHLSGRVLLQCVLIWSLLLLVIMTISNFELVDDPEVSICLGSDEEIVKMIENDKRFYERVSVDQLPVGGEDHE